MKRRKGGHAQPGERVDADDAQERLVHDPEDGHDVLVLGLGDELGEEADVVERALGVRVAHDAVQPVDAAQPAGVVVA